jgi:hypothetical protein
MEVWPHSGPFRLGLFLNELGPAVLRLIPAPPLYSCTLQLIILALLFIDRYDSVKATQAAKKLEKTGAVDPDFTHPDFVTVTCTQGSGSHTGLPRSRDAVQTSSNPSRTSCARALCVPQRVPLPTFPLPTPALTQMTTTFVMLPSPLSLSS